MIGIWKLWFFQSTLFHLYFTKKQMRIYTLKKLVHVCVFYETIKVSDLGQVTERVITCFMKIQKTSAVDLFTYKVLIGDSN